MEIVNLIKSIDHKVNDWEKLHEAVIERNPDVLKYLIKKGVNVDALNKWNSTPLYVAVKRQFIDIARLLLLAGADPDIPGGNMGYTPLHLSVEMGDVRFVKLLLGFNASIASASTNGYKPLHIAVVNNQLEAAKLILKAGDGSGVMDRNNTALHLAIVNNNKEMVDLLLASGANVDIYSASATNNLKVVRALLLQNDRLVSSTFLGGETALHAAARFGANDVVNILINSGANTNEQGASMMTPLDLAVFNGNVSAASILLKNGAKVNPKTHKNKTRTPLHIAAKTGDFNMIKFLLDHGAKTDAPTETIAGISPLGFAFGAGGRRPLHLAAASDCTGCVNLLLKGGAKVNATDINKRPPLMVAISSGPLSTIELLIKAGAKVNKRYGLQKETPLKAAVIAGRPNVVELLINNGAEVSAKDAVGFTPLHTAIMAPSIHAVPLSLRTSVVRMLVLHGADINEVYEGKSMLHTAASFANSETVKILLDAGVDVNTPHKHGGSPLASAAFSGKIDIVAVLLSRGADVNQAGRNGNTPLHSAAAAKHHLIIEMLLEKGANGSAKTTRNETPLRVFLGALRHNSIYPPREIDKSTALLLASSITNNKEVERTFDGIFWPVIMGRDLPIIKLLIDCGANVNHKKADGTTYLHSAAKYGNFNIVQLLVSNGAKVNSKDSSGKTALDYALKLENGRSQIVNYLRGKGGVSGKVAP